MDSYDSESRLIFSHFSRSTKSAFFCTAQISKFQQKTRHNFADHSENFWIIIHSKIREILIENVNFRRNFDEMISEFLENITRIFSRKYLALRTVQKKLHYDDLGDAT